MAAAFCVDLDAAGVVRRARLAYGGVAETPRRARRAEAALEGRRLAEAAPAVAGLLATEFQPIDDVRGSAAYRRALVVSLWEKFVAGEQSDAQDGALDFDHGAAWPDTDASRALRHESGAGHVTGGALYVDDLAQRRPMLDAWPVLSTHARARLVRRDATAARARAGRGGGAAGRGHSRREQRRVGAARRAAARGGRGVLPRPDDRAGGGRVGARLPAGGGTGRGGLRAAAAGAHAGRGGGAEQFSHGAARPRARRLRGGAGGGALPAGRASSRWAGRSISTSRRRRPGPSRGRRAPCSCVPRPSIRRKSRRWWPRCSGGRATRW